MNAPLEQLQNKCSKHEQQTFYLRISQHLFSIASYYRNFLSENGSQILRYHISEAMKANILSKNVSCDIVPRVQVLFTHRPAHRELAVQHAGMVTASSCQTASTLNLNTSPYICILLIAMTFSFLQTTSNIFAIVSSMLYY